MSFLNTNFLLLDQIRIIAIFSLSSYSGFWFYVIRVYKGVRTIIIDPKQFSYN